MSLLTQTQQKGQKRISVIWIIENPDKKKIQVNSQSLTLLFLNLSLMQFSTDKHMATGTGFTSYRELMTKRTSKAYNNNNYY